MRTQGHGLLECMIVVALLTTLAYMGLYTIRWTQHMAVRECLDTLYLLLLSLSQQALHSGKTITLTCSPNGTLQSPDSIYHLPSHIRFGTASSVLGPPATPINTVSDPITFPQHQITCYPDSIMSSGTLYLTDDDRSCTYALTCAVGIMSYLRLYRFEEGNWVLLER